MTSMSNRAKKKRRYHLKNGLQNTLGLDQWMTMMNEYSAICAKAAFLSGMLANMMWKNTTRQVSEKMDTTTENI